MWHYFPDLLARPVPRYTSYPTANLFDDRVGAADLARAVHGVAPGQSLSVYIHIPFCEQICWYCGCNTGKSNKRHRLEAYLETLYAEISMVGRMLGGRAHLKRIAFGGGSPNAIAPIDFIRLVDHVQTVFTGRDPAISVELDPRGLTSEWSRVLAAGRVRRVSMGVQTFAPHVQAAIGRVQPRELIEQSITELRLRGIREINFDLMYGLPRQTLADVDDSVATTIALGASRVSLFGYAHLPTLIPRQRQVDATALPDARLRFDQAAAGHQRLVAAGYVPVGFDHFALPTDSLAVAAAAGSVRRNFQGFTEDDSDVMLGFGASAISMVGGVIAQNEKNAGRWRMLVSAGQLSANRGVAPDADDRMRGAVIEQLLCAGRADLSGLADDAARDAALRPFLDRRLALLVDGTLCLTEDGRPYARSVAALFDRHLSPPSDAGASQRVAAPAT